MDTKTDTVEVVYDPARTNPAALAEAINTHTKFKASAPDAGAGGSS